MKYSHEEYRELLNPSFSVTHKIAAINDKFDFHIHDQFELLLNLSDDICCTIGDTTYDVKKNTLLIFNNLDLHHMFMKYHRGIYNRYVLHFLPEIIAPFSSSDTDLLECFFYRPFKDANILPLPQEMADKVQCLLDRLIEANTHKKEPKDSYGHDLNIQFLLGELLIKVNLIYRQMHSIRLKNEQGGNSYGKIYTIINYMNMNYMKNISLDSLAKRFYINKSYLCSLFKDVIGMSPMQYRIHCRVQHAKELLIENHSVNEACDLTGYNNLSHFSRSFKQCTGKSPKQFQSINHRL
jgi:AraC-like DNA-binding protein